MTAVRFGWMAAVRARNATGDSAAKLAALGLRAANSPLARLPAVARLAGLALCRADLPEARSARTVVFLRLAMAVPLDRFEAPVRRSLARWTVERNVLGSR